MYYHIHIKVHTISYAYNIIVLIRVIYKLCRYVYIFINIDKERKVFCVHCARYILIINCSHYIWERNEKGKKTNRINEFH